MSPLFLPSAVIDNGAVYYTSSRIHMKFCLFAQFILISWPYIVTVCPCCVFPVFPCHPIAAFPSLSSSKFLYQPYSTDVCPQSQKWTSSSVSEGITQKPCSFDPLSHNEQGRHASRPFLYWHPGCRMKVPWLSKQPSHYFQMKTEALNLY